MKKKIKKENKDTENKKVGIDFGIGKFSIGGLFRGIEKVVDLAERVEKAGGEIRKSGTIGDLKGSKDVRGVYGITLRTGLGQKARKKERRFR